MDLLESLEYNRPIIKISIDNIFLKTSVTTEFFFKIENVGSGVLEGTIFYSEKFITINKSNFEGNRVNISCIFEVKDFKYGDVIKSDITIISNGGDVVIPVVLEITKEFLQTRDGTRLYNLNDFMKYYEKNPIESKSLFYTANFEKFIENLNSTYISIYKHVIEDENAERGIENFFLMLDLKEKCKVAFVENYAEIKVSPFAKKVAGGKIELKKIGKGYFSFPIKSTSWIKLHKNFIESQDFDENDNYQLEYIICSDFKNNIALGQVIIDNDEENKFLLKVKKLDYANISINKEVYNNNETAYLYIENLLNIPINFAITSDNTNVSIEKNSIIVNDKISIPFFIKLTPIEIGRVAILKQPYFVSSIKIIGTVEDSRFTKVIPITIGTKNLELK